MRQWVFFRTRISHGSRKQRLHEWDWTTDELASKWFATHDQRAKDLPKLWANQHNCSCKLVWWCLSRPSHRRITTSLAKSSCFTNLKIRNIMQRGMLQPLNPRPPFSVGQVRPSATSEWQTHHEYQRNYHPIHINLHFQHSGRILGLIRGSNIITI